MVYISNYAIITGATGGIGLAIAKELAADGYNLVLAGKNRPRLNEVAAQIQKDYKEIEIFVEVLDLTIEHNCEHLIDKYRDEVEILVNNAGVADYGFLSDTSATNLREMTHLNVIAPVLLTRFAMQSLHKNHGYILNISSQVADGLTPKMAVYGATKAFMTYFGESLRMEVEYQNLNISVTNAYPTVTDTEFYYRCGLNTEQIQHLFDTYKPLTPEHVAKEAVDAMFRQESSAVITPNPRFEKYLKSMREQPGIDILNVKNVLHKESI